jgi:protoporphyrinogen oxidase
MDVLVVGSGIAGLFAALTLTEQNPGTRVTVVESANEPGGLLAGFRYPEPAVEFDCGTHIFRETGVAAIDGLLLGCLAPTDWLLYPRGAGDIVGSVHGGRLGTGSHFPDLRSHPLRDVILDEVRAANTSCVTDDLTCVPLDTWSRARFGPTAHEKIIKPSLEAIYKRDSKELSAFAALAAGLTRLTLVDEGEWIEHVQGTTLGKVIAHPDQRRLPVALTSEQRSYYPRTGGTRALISGAIERLRARGVEVALGCRLDAKGWTANDDVTEAKLVTREGTEVVAADQIIWAAGLFPLAVALGEDLRSFGFDAPMSHKVVNLQFSRADLGDLFYVIGHDPAAGFFRLTNYDAFAPSASPGRITVEILGSDVEAPEDVIMQTVDAIAGIGAVPRVEVPHFAHVHVLAQGFPVPTLRNFAAVSQMRNAVEARLPGNVALCGVHARGGLFFQNDVLKHTYQTIRARFCGTA